MLQSVPEMFYCAGNVLPLEAKSGGSQGDKEPCSRITMVAFISRFMELSIKVSDIFLLYFLA